MTTDDRCHQYAITAFKLSAGLPLAPSAEAADDSREAIVALADAVIATRCAPGLARMGFTVRGAA